MATPEAAESAAIAVGSHETALCIIPPRQQWSSVDRLRALYDKAYQKWPPHVNLIYPFVRVDTLEKAIEQIRSGLEADWRPQHGSAGLRVRLDSAGVFTHRHDNTIYMHDSDKSRNDALKALRRSILKALGHKANNFQMHMTVAQSDDVKGDRHQFLLQKVQLLPNVEWDVGQLVILVRERIQLEGSATSCMKTWGTISLADLSLAREDQPRGFYEIAPRTAVPESSDEEAEAEIDELQSGSPYSYDAETALWKRYDPRSRESSQTSPKTLAVASYNVLAEFTFPPSQARYPLIVKNILSKNAVADVLVLQEASDDFLSYLLEDENIRAAYPFVSHGPPEQADVDPLPSLLNLVVLSKWAFEWEWVSFKRPHKGSIVARFSNIGKWDDAEFLPLVLATVHLTCGLTDGSVASKKIEIQRILKFLATEYPDHPWILAGDFNITTSSFTLEAALKKNAISAQTASYLTNFDSLFEQAGLVDAWTYSRHDLGDASDGEVGCSGGSNEMFEGEQGATYDPTVNALAAEIVGSGFNNRPQRYDRILVRGEELLHVVKFNKFGFLAGAKPDAETKTTTYPSDHWGVRCLLRVGSEAVEAERPMDGVAELVVPVKLTQASASLSDIHELRAALVERQAIPTEEEAAEREAAFQLLKTVLLEPSPGEAGDAAALQRLRSSLVVTPVGSYGLGVWTPSSDVDCMCIGPISSTTFFALATLRLRKAAARGVTILRRVAASSGTMLELEVQGIKMDLQYCASAAVAENWPDVLRLPASDPVFSLSPQTLAKLKAARDLDYLRRSLPDPVKFRLAHRLIKTWAKSRGIYAARFGYLGGFQISILLARVCKLVARESASAGTTVTVPDLVATFFAHYAAFDWAADLVFDPFFHKQRLAYKRTAREPLAILGYHAPGLNTAHAASLPSVRTLAEEMRRAHDLLSTAADNMMTWSAFLGGKDSGAADFLTAYKTYVRIDVQYWGLSLAKGAGFVGWLESRCVLLLVDINRRLPNVHARMWPARFVELTGTAAAVADATTAEDDDDNDNNDDDDARDYQGCYLVGLDAAKMMSREDEQLAAGALHSVLQRFEERIRSDEHYFDAKSEWMGASVVRRAELGELVEDARAWGAYTPGDDETDEDEEEEDDEEENDEDEDASGSAGEKGEASRKKGTKKGGKKNRKDKQAAGPKLEPGRKFRSAVDVISRLRWDPSLDSGDYIVGYEDRFVGARERALDLWKSEQTDEEFIPQHRVLYFKRKSDGVIVWERKTRIDEIFGSGV